jgi:glycosyltransferase involved in cell wall biosynthesis
LAVWDLLLAALSLLIALGWVAVLVVSRRNVSLVPSLGRSEGNEDRLTVSVIVPARNEAKVLPATLESLLAQRVLRKEVILVDDHSTDGTELTTSLYLDRGVVYVRPPRTPEGWMGKSWACHFGYLNSRGEWLVFVDADSRMMDERLLGDAIGTAVAKGIDAFSLIPRLSTDRIASRVMLPTLLMLMYFLAPPSKSNDPSERLAFFFGAFIAVRRSAYEAVGGHASVRSELLDDKALGELLKASGKRTALIDASERFEAEFAGTFRDHLGGLMRLFTQYALDEAKRRGNPFRRLSRYLVGGLLFFGGPIALPLLAISTAQHPLVVGVSLTPLLASLASQALYLRWMGERMRYAPLAPLAHLVILLALIRVSASTLKGKAEVRWHGRTYVADLRSGTLKLV